MAKISVSAPGKLMLLGEHAIVYGRPCIVTAVNQRMKATIELINKPVFELNAPDVQISNFQKPMSNLGQGDIPKGAKFVEIAIKNFAERYPIKTGIKVRTESEFSSLFGFGSSSASTVCVIKALSEITGVKLDNKKIFDLSYKTVLDIQGKGSGFDVAAAVYGGTIYYVSPGKIIEPLNIDSIPLVVGYSGIKADTVTLMNQVLEKAKTNPKLIEKTYTSIGRLVEQAKLTISSKDWKALGKLMNANQKLLKTLGVSINKLDDMINAANNTGAYGAKLSGAGGGDCMIALSPTRSKILIEKAVSKSGGQVINVETNAEGVRIER